MASIIERAGDDSQIPGDVNEGCGTLSADAHDETAKAHRADSKSQPLEARGEATEQPGAGGGTVKAGGVGAGKGENGGNCERGGVDSRAKTADGVVRILSAAGMVPERMPARADVVDGFERACFRCGEKNHCACVNGGGGTEGGATRVGGSTSPGRPFGSPTTQNKGARNVMSWTMGNSAVEDHGSSGLDDDQLDTTSSNKDLSAKRRRSSRTSGGGDGVESNRHLSTTIASSEESLEPYSLVERSIVGSQDTAGGQEASAQSGRETKRGDQVVEFGRPHIKDAGNGSDGSDSDHNADSAGSTCSVAAHEAARPMSSRSPVPGSSARLKRLSGGSRSRSRGSQEGDNLGGKGTPHSMAIENASPRREGCMDNKEETLFVHNEYQQGDTALAPTKLAVPRGFPVISELSGRVDAFRGESKGATGNEPRTGDEKPTKVCLSFTGSTSLESENDEWSASVGGPNPSSMVGLEAGAMDEGPAGARGDTKVKFPRMSSRTPRSPRLAGSGSETSKTAKRLSEALTFAACGSVEQLDKVAAIGAVAKNTPRRESSIVGGPLLTAAAAAADTTPRRTSSRDGWRCSVEDRPRPEERAGEGGVVLSDTIGEPKPARERGNIHRESPTAVAAAVDVSEN